MIENNSCEWEGLLLPLDTESVDGRIVRREDLKAPISLPMALMQLGDTGGSLAGTITRMEETKAGIYGHGVAHDKSLVERLRRGDRVAVGATVLDGHFRGLTVCEKSAFEDAYIEIVEGRKKK